MNRYFWLIIILIIFLITLGVLVYYIRFAVTIAPKASTFNTVNIVSISNSYVFASPVRAKASGDLIRVTVFLLDDEGRGIFDKKVSLRALEGVLDIKDVQSLTDETGKAMFDLGSSVIGTFSLEAVTEKLVLPQKIKVIYD
ncbi:MAG: Ig-like domain-containing protein [bacterium]|nr:Ig-like domain-containing protein [bacterium]